MDKIAPDNAELALRARVRGDFYVRSRFHRNRLERSGLGKKGVRSVADLSQLPPMTLGDVTTPSTLLLTSGKEKPANARRYLPVEWVQAGEVPLSYSDDDVFQMASLGSQMLRAAGIKPADLIANLIPMRANREHLQLSWGAQRLGVGAIDLGPNQNIETIAMLDPTVLIGEAPELSRLLDLASLNDDILPRLHTVIITGPEPTPRQHKRILEKLGNKESAIVRVWAPDGVLALWGQCRGGSAFHTWPGIEVIEVVDPVSGLPVPEGTPGILVWSGIGWYSSAVLRLNTGAAVIARSGPCPDCGRKSLRLEPLVSTGGFPDILDSSPNIKSWAAELQRTTGQHNDIDELVIWVEQAESAGLLQLLTELNLKIGPVQLNLVDEAEVQRRIVEANGERFTDRRSF